MVTTSKAKLLCLAACPVWALPLPAEQPPHAELITAHRIGTTPPRATYLATHHPAPYAPLCVFPLRMPSSNPGKGHSGGTSGGGSSWLDSALQTSSSLSSSPTGVRWYQLTGTGTSTSGWRVDQEGTFGAREDDSNYRWMGSIAQDKLGSIGIGYSVPGPNMHPGIAYTVRVQGDAAGKLETEVQLFGGQGAQSSVNRWGDYSSMSVDPTDDCTKWFATEYGNTTDSYYAWRTYITSFKLGTCS